MVTRALRSRSLRKISRKVPGGRVTIHYKERKAHIASCAGCGSALKGVARVLPSKFGSLSKSQKRPSRPFGGKLCSSCARTVHVQQSRSL